MTWLGCSSWRSAPLCFALLAHGFLAAAKQPSLPSESGPEDCLAPEDFEIKQILSAEWSELPGAATQDFESRPMPLVFGNTASSAQQQAGALTGKIVFMNSGHGWTWDSGFSPPWRLQRPVLNLMNEDYGNLDQLNFFAAYCFNAGATVVSMRPLGHQTSEVVLDNDDSAVTWAGSWSDSASGVFWGSAGDLPYRYASLAATETATATYTPNLPVGGFYPVYTWVRHGTDRGDQLYRIRHTGGEAQVRIPHHRVGNGWVYLGEYYFNAGSSAANGSVVVSNWRGTPAGSVVIADAIRFGNGMGSVDQGGGVSGYPREDENMRYWVKANLAQGQSAGLFDGSGADESDSWSAPPRMSAEMNAESSGDIYDRVHISFHSNAGGGRGTVALITSDPTPNQAELATIAGGEVNDDLVALGAPPLEYAWFDRAGHTYSGGYSEIDGSFFNYEMAATIIEVAFHDSSVDAALMRDPKARSAVGKAAMQAVIKFMNQFDTNDPPPLAFLPEPPTNLRAAAGTNGQIALDWAMPITLGGSQNPTNYIIYRSTNGYGFGNPVFTGNVTAFTISNLTAGIDYYFRVTAANAGGESMPSEVAGCRCASTNGAPRVLVVNAFDRFDRTTDLRHNVAAQSWGPPGNNGAIERVYPRWNNAFDYIVQHGKALAAAGRAFDSCQNEAVASGLVALTNYPIVIWACGNETTNSESFSAAEQAKITTYLGANGNLFVSGADIAFDLDGPAAASADRAFLHNQLRAALTNDNSASYAAVPTATGLFAGRTSVAFDNGTKGIYWVQTPDVIGSYGPGASPAMTYSAGVAAAVQYDGSAGGGRSVLLGFPFETITSAARRAEYMADILNFLGAPPASNVPPAILTPPQSQFVIQGSNTILSVAASGTFPLGYQWRFNGTDLPGATLSTLARNNVQPSNSGNYLAVVSNAFGVATTAVAQVQAMLPPLLTLFADSFDADTAANWTLNRSSTDCRAAFNYNYSADGIASAPNSTGGTTRGLKLEANVSLGVPAAISASPIGQSFGGDYRLRFDLWMNQNGPFPAGGTGSTQHGTAGIGTAGDRVQWTGAGSNADGLWFAANGEGQASDTSTTSINDFGAFSSTTYYAAASGIYAAGTATDARGNLNAYYAARFPAGQTAPAAQSITWTQQTGGLAAGTIGFKWRDIIISKSGSTVEWSIDGLRMATVTGAALSASNIFVGLWDYFASLSDNTNLSFVIYDNVRVERFVTNVPPFITLQPAGQTLSNGGAANFSVSAGGSAPLAYQWRLGGTNISGATGSVYIRNNVQAADAGVYAVLVTNAFGAVLSVNAPLVVRPSQPLRLGVVGLQPDNTVRFRIEGEPGFDVQVQCSTNTWHWLPASLLPNPTGTTWFTSPETTNVPSLFYRAYYP